MMSRLCRVRLLFVTGLAKACCEPHQGSKIVIRHTVTFLSKSIVGKEWHVVIGDFSENNSDTNDASSVKVSKLPPNVISWWRFRNRSLHEPRILRILTAVMSTCTGITWTHVECKHKYIIWMVWECDTWYNANNGEGELYLCSKYEKRCLPEPVNISRHCQWHRQWNSTGRDIKGL